MRSFARLAVLGSLLAGCGTQPAPSATGVPPAATATPAPAASPAASAAPTASAPGGTPAPLAEVEVPRIEKLPDPASFPDTPSGLANGAWAPELALTDLRIDKPFRLSELVGPQATSPAAVIVGFTASWCGYCQRSYPFLANLQKEHAGKLRVVLVSLDEDKASRLKEVAQVQAAGLDAPVLQGDEATFRAWLGRKRNLPHFYVVNQAGEILVQDRGFGDKVKKVLPGQVDYALRNPTWVRRG